GVVVSANAGAAGESREGVPTGAFGHAFGRIRTPAIAPPSYLIPGPIGQTLVAARAGGDLGRYLSFDPKQTQPRRGWLARQAPRFWPAYENGRSILFDIYEIQGYSTIQIDRYWRMVRRVATR